MGLGRMSLPNQPRSPPSARVAGSSEYSRASRLKSSPDCARCSSSWACFSFSCAVAASAPSGIATKMWLARTCTLVVALHIGVGHADLRADRDVDDPILQDLAFRVLAIGGETHALLAQFIAQLGVVDAVVLLDLFDGLVDLLAADGNLEIGRLLHQELIVHHAFENLPAQGRGPRGPLAGIGDGGDVSHHRRRPVLHLALQNDVAANHRDDLLNHARLTHRRQQEQKGNQGQSGHGHRFLGFGCGHQGRRRNREVRAGRRRPAGIRGGGQSDLGQLVFVDFHPDRLARLFHQFAPSLRTHLIEKSPLDVDLHLSKWSRHLRPALGQLDDVKALVRRDRARDVVDSGEGKGGLHQSLG